MSILINGMEMPKDEAVALYIYPDGRAKLWRSQSAVSHELEAVPVQPHGDLIDRDALMKGEGRYIISFGKEGIDVAEIYRAPTIIPAELSKEET